MTTKSTGSDCESIVKNAINSYLQHGRHGTCEISEEFEKKIELYINNFGQFSTDRLKTMTNPGEVLHLTLDPSIQAKFEELAFGFRELMQDALKPENLQTKSGEADRIPQKLRRSGP